MFGKLKNTIQIVREAYLAAGIVFLIAIAGFFLVGRVYSDIMARMRIESMLPAMQTLCFAVITSSSTIIALLMAVLGFARRIDNDFDQTFYSRIWFIATLATVSLIMAALMLLLITIPITEADSLQTWYSVIYWIMVFFASSMMALLVGMIVSLYRTIYGLITLLSPQWEAR